MSDDTTQVRVSDVMSKSLSNMSYPYVAPAVGSSITLRPEVAAFAVAMELKLRKNDHKTTWRDKPVEALVRLMVLELEEFRVAHEFFDTRDSRGETVDIANFAMIVWDRLGYTGEAQ